MKLEAPKLRQARMQRQEIWRRARATSPALRGIFPRVELLQIELKFVDHMAHTPADQRHTMHPAAQAFFSFPCPYADCDGAYDLAAAVKEVVASSAHHCEGDVHCTGHRVRDGNNGQACGLKLHYTVKVHLRRAPTSARETADAAPG